MLGHGRIFRGILRGCSKGGLHIGGPERQGAANKFKKSAKKT